MFDPMFSEQSQRQVLSLFMKATVLREITVPAYTRHDGVVVPSHRKMVHIDPDRSVTDVVNGQGSHSQRAAHRRLSSVPGFHAKDELDRYHHILSHATSLQRRASQSAALSGWRAAARAGRNPSASQWAAFNALDADKQATETAQVETVAGGTGHLVNPSASTSPAAAPAIAEPAPATLPLATVGDHQVMADEAGQPIVFFHGGADVSSSALSPLTFFAADRGVAQGYLDGGTQAGNGRVHAAYLSIRNPAKDADVNDAARAVGIYNEHENAHQYLTPEVYGDQALAVMRELQRLGFDGASVTDMPMSGGDPFTSLAIFSSGQVVPASNSASGAAAMPNPETREGATKTVDGVEYVLRDGRWHRASPDEPVGQATQPTVALDGQNYQRGTDGAWRLVIGDGDDAAYHPVRNGHILTRLEAAERRRSGQAAPVPAVAVASPLATPTVDHAAVMAAVPVPDMSHLSDSATNAGTRRRMAQLAAVAAAGDYDAVVNFTTSRSRANYALVADYRDALIDRVSRAGTTAQHAASAIARPVPPAPVIDEPSAAVVSPVAGAAPAAPTITGSNPNNSALIAAQARVRALERASLAADPVPAILAVTTTRHNYMRQADDYRTALLAHFGHSAGGGELVSSAEVAAAPTAAMARRRRRPTPAPAAAPSASAPVPPSQNPLIAANPHGASEAELGFVPRPNVPLTMRTTSLPPGYRWPHPEMEELNRRYLAQSTTLQTRARDYQAGTWVPDTPQVRAARLEQARLQAERDRAALAEIERRRASIPDVFRPINTPGNNVTGVTISRGALEAARAICGINSKVELELFAKTIVADFGADETFSIQVGGLPNSFDVILRGSNGTQIKRTFRKTATGASVYHAFFEAGRTGSGSGRHLFRTSMGLYQQYGIKEVTVTANIDVGGYAWARFGYKASNWPSLQRELKSRLDTLSRGVLAVQIRDTAGNTRRWDSVPALTAEQVRKVRQVLENADPRTVWAIADMKVGGRSVGKEMLLGTSWAGVIPLDDASAMERFTNYVTPRS